ncbi:TPA: hypothetical protein QHC28_000654 [Aeromonas veronii bv. veronii]|nr:hypothetical protein [Aeromonas veronii bv. veronii]
MSALDPVILNGVSNVAKAVAELANQPKGDTVLLDIPVRKGHSFVEGDVALYDTERGDLHDGRAEFEVYFSPESGGASVIASARQSSTFDERDDGSLLVASLFRDSNNSEGTESYSTNHRLELGLRDSSGNWTYASAIQAGSYVGYLVAETRLIRVSADEYMFLCITRSTSGYYISARSIRIVNGALVIGAFTSSNNEANLGSVSSTYRTGGLHFCVGQSELLVLAADASGTFGLIFKSVNGVISKANVNVSEIPRETGLYQIDSKRVLFPESAKLITFQAGAMVVSPVSVDVSRLPAAPSYARNSFSFSSLGYDASSDVLPGIFAPEDYGSKRVYFSDGMRHGGFEVDGLTVRVYPPLQCGGIGDDRKYYSGEVPLTSKHPAYTSGLTGNAAYGCQFVRKALSGIPSTTVSEGIAGQTRVKMGGVFVTGGFIFIRQSGPSALAPIGVGGKVVARKYDATFDGVSDFVGVRGAGLLRRPSFKLGMVRYPRATIYLRERSGTQDFFFSEVRSPSFVKFLTQSVSATTRFWTCMDGVFSAASAGPGNPGTIPPSTYCASRLGFFFDYPVKVGGNNSLTIEISEAFV